MINIFPPELTLNVSDLPFQLIKEDSVDGIFKLSDLSFPEVATVTEEGLVSLLSPGTVIVNLVSGNSILSSCIVNVIDTVPAVTSHLRMGYESVYPISYNKINNIPYSGSVIFFPERVTSDRNPNILFEAGVTVKISRNGQDFFTPNEYKRFIPEVKLESNVISYLENRVGYRLTNLHSFDGSITVRLSYNNGNNQDYVFNLLGPVSVSYSPNYGTDSLELDIETDLSLEGTVNYKDGSSSDLVSYQSLNEDILLVSPDGVVSGVRSTLTRFPTFSNTKKDLRGFVQLKNKIYSSAFNKIYEFSPQDGYVSSLYDIGQPINIRGLSSVPNGAIYYYISVNPVDGTYPKSAVYRIYPSIGVSVPVAHIKKKATAFSIVQTEDGLYWGLLGVENKNNSEFYLFPHGVDDLDLRKNLTTVSGTVVKILASHKGWAFLLFKSGSIFALNLKNGSLVQISSINIGASTIAADYRSDTIDLWVYGNKNDGNIFIKKIVVEDGYITKGTFDYGNLNKNTGVNYIKDASVVSGIHYLVFTNQNPSSEPLSDPPPDSFSVRPLDVESGDVYFINDHLGVIDLTVPVVGFVKIISTEDPSVSISVPIKINPKGTKNPYAIDTQTESQLLNFETGKKEQIPARMVFSDGTFSGSAIFDLSYVSQGSGISLSTSGTYLYAFSDRYNQSKLKIESSIVSGLSVEYVANFYPKPIAVGIGDRNFVRSSVTVKSGGSISLESYIFTSGNQVYPYSLNISSNNSGIAVASSYPEKIIISGVSVGATQIYYNTPQPLSTVIQGYFTVNVVPQAIPYYIRIPNERYGSIYLPYTPASLINPLKSFPVEISGQIVYTDNKTLPYNSGIAWSIVSGSDNFTISGTTLNFYPPEYGSNPAGKLRASSVLYPEVYRDVTLYALESEDTTPYRIVFPDYVVESNRFVKLTSIPRKMISFQVLRANNTLVYGNPLAEFSVSGTSVEVIPDSYGSLAQVDGEFGISTLKIKVGSLEDTIDIQVGGPDQIKTNLPFYKVDVGSRLNYATGTAFDSDKNELEAVEVITESPKEYEVSSNVSGILRGSLDSYLPKPDIPLSWASVTEINTLSVLNTDGVLKFYNSDKAAVTFPRFEHDNVTANLFDMPRSDLGYVVFNQLPSYSGKSYIVRKDGSAAFKKWGYISGTVLDICVVGNYVFLAREVNGTRQVGKIARASYSPRDGKTLDYAFSEISGITGANRVTRDKNSVICTTLSGNSYLAYDTSTNIVNPIQIFSGSYFASSLFSISDKLNVYDRDFRLFGTLPSGSSILAGGPVFYIKNSDGSISIYRPTVVNSLNLEFYAKNFSTQTKKSVPIEVLPSGSSTDYYMLTEVDKVNDIYIGDSREVLTEIFSSDGTVHSRRDIFLNNVEQKESSVVFKEGGTSYLKVVSKDNKNLQSVKEINVRRRVKSIKVQNFIDESGFISINVDSTVNFEAFVEYEDGFVDKNVTIEVPEESLIFIKKEGDLGVRGLSVTEGGSSTRIRFIAKESQRVQGGTNYIDAQVKVYPAGTKKLSYFSLPSEVEAEEQSLVGSNQVEAKLFYTDGSFDYLYEEGFVEELDGLQIFDQVVDLTSAGDRVFAIVKKQQTYFLDIYSYKGTLISRKEILLSEPNKVRVNKEEVFLSNKNAVYRLDDYSNPIYGQNSPSADFNILDFSFSKDSLYVLNVTADRASLVTVLPTLSIKLLTVNDISGFCILSSGKVFLLSQIRGVIDLDGNTLSGLNDASSISAFEDEIYLTLKHRIVRILQDGSLYNIAGSVFSGLNNGYGSLVRFNSPSAISIDSRRRIYVADSGNYTIRRHVNGVTTSLAGGFWSSSDPDVAIGLGPSIQTLKPGQATLSVSYKGVSKDIIVYSRPLYTGVKIKNIPLRTVLGSNRKGKIALEADIYTISGLATGSYIERINYPAKVEWSSDYNYLNGNNFSPTKVGKSVVRATISGSDPKISSAANVTTETLLLTGISFKQPYYITEVNKPISFHDQVELFYNDGVIQEAQGLVFSGTTTTDGDLIKTSEYEGIVSTSYSGLTAQTVCYIYPKDIGLRFDTSSASIYAGTSRDISAEHTGTLLFKNRLISYTVGSSLSDYLSVSESGIASANSKSQEIVSGSLSAQSLIIGNVLDKKISVVPYNTFSHFSKITQPYIIHSGNTYLKLKDISVQVFDSKNSSINSVVDDRNFSLPVDAKASISREVDTEGIVFNVIKYKDSGSLSLFSGTFTHGLQDLPPVIRSPQYLDVPMLSVAPTGIRIEIDGTDLESIFLVEGSGGTNVSINLEYNDSYSDVFYEINPDSKGFLLEGPISDGIFKIYPLSLGYSINSRTSYLEISYLYDNSIKFKIPVTVTKVPVVRSVTIIPDVPDILCLDLLPIQAISALVKMTDNTISKNGYVWDINGSESAELDLFNLAEGSEVQAKSVDLDENGLQKLSRKIKVYQKLINIKNSTDLQRLADLGLLEPEVKVNFVPEIIAKLDLNATLPTIIKPIATINGIEAINKTELQKNKDFMIDETLKAVFARKIKVLSSGSNLVVGDSRSKTLFIEQNGKKGLFLGKELLPLQDGHLTADASGIVLESGYAVQFSSGILFYDSNPKGARFQFDLPINGMSYQSGNSLIAVTADSIYRLTANFTNKSVAKLNLGPKPSFAFKELIISPSGTLRYLTDQGISVAKTLSTYETILSGSFEHSCFITEHKYFASSGSELFYLDSIKNETISLGQVDNDFGNIVSLDPLSNEYVYVKTQNGYSLSISKFDNTTKIVANHLDNKNISDSLTVEVLAPEQEINYILAFTPSSVQVKESGSFKASAYVINSDGSFKTLQVSANSDDKITFDSSFISYNNGYFKALNHGSTVISGVSSGLTGTLNVTSSAIITGIEVFSDFIAAPNDLAVVSEGYYLPYKIRGRKTDNSLSTDILVKESENVVYSSDLLYGKKSTISPQILYVSALENSSIKKQIPLTVLNASDVRVSNFKVTGPDSASLSIGDSYFIENKVYYTDGTVNSYVKCSLESTASGIEVIDTNIVRATGIDDGHTVTASPRAVEKFPTDIVFDKRINITVSEKYGIVRKGLNGSTVVYIKVENSSKIPNLYFDFSKLLPTVTQVNGPSAFHSLALEIDPIDKTKAIIKAEARHNFRGQTVPIKISLGDYELQDGIIDYVIPKVDPSLEFEFSSYVLSSDLTNKVYLKTYLKYDKYYKELVKSDIIGQFVSKDDKGNYFLQINGEIASKDFTITATSAGNLTATASVFIKSGQESRLKFFDNGNIVSSFVITPYYETAGKAYLVDSNLLPVEINGVFQQDLNFNTTGFSVKEKVSNYIPFTVSGTSSFSAIGSLVYRGSAFTESIKLNYINTKVKDLSLALLSSNNYPIYYYVNQPINFNLSVQFHDGSNLYIKAGYSNPDLLNGGDSNSPVKKTSMIDLFDIYLGATKLTNQFSLQSVNTGPNVTPIAQISFTSAAVSLFTGNNPLPLLFKLKGTEKSTNPSQTIILRDLPKFLLAENTELDKYLY